MRRCFFVFLAFTVPAFADEKAKPTPLTPTEVADGWLLLFDGESTFGWQVEGDAKVEGGTLQLNGGAKGASLTTPVAFAACDLRLRLAKGSGNGQVEFVRGGSKSGIGLPAQAVDFRATVRPGGGSESSVNTEAGPDGVAVLRAEVTVDGPAVLRIVAAPGQTLLIRSAAGCPKEMKAIFNGKDLAGWKVFPGAKDRKVTSKFSVTKEGWLNVKDGPGDLQTDGQWADFIAQFDCISNGKHLNSGLFFRCLPDQYQQGYEAQIRNEWTGDDRTKPVDYGTGAIYRRQAARKVVASDGEWFTMTVAARGRHLMTWVNGYPVAAWADDRKEGDNARQGFKAGTGALSIQGHDATTDLSFRNLRVQSLDGK